MVSLCKPAKQIAGTHGWRSFYDTILKLEDREQTSAEDVYTYTVQHIVILLRIEFIVFYKGRKPDFPLNFWSPYRYSKETNLFIWFKSYLKWQILNHIFILYWGHIYTMVHQIPLKYPDGLFIVSKHRWPHFIFMSLNWLTSSRSFQKNYNFGTIGIIVNMLIESDNWNYWKLKQIFIARPQKGIAELSPRTWCHGNVWE